ncbi:pyruvate kinase isozyme G, chloroplastic isoform X2 [Durio zibethinus]|uniref:Pyruvate kinase n=1 Tax=Durio zibethinus TaxID=66656 RepID=A0A6P5WPL6_DURZI|nr:pyruvate kinase isozyme G, chloroplastic isoform X2 [Durio zibethinus]
MCLSSLVYITDKEQQNLSPNYLIISETRQVCFAISKPKLVVVLAFFYPFRNISSCHFPFSLSVLFRSLVSIRFFFFPLFHFQNKQQKQIQMATITALTDASAADLSSFRNITDHSLFESGINRTKRRLFFRKGKASFSIRSMRITQTGALTSTNGRFNADKLNSMVELLNSGALGQVKRNSSPRRKTKIVCTIGPSTSSREMIWKLAEAGMNVARLNMSHGDHASHKKTIDLVKEYNAQFEDKVIAIMLDTKGPEVRSGDVPQPIQLKEGQEFNFTIRRGVCKENTVSVNYDDFVNDVEVGDILLVDGGMMSLAVKSKTKDSVKCVVVDGGELKSRRHLNVRGKSATLPSITDKDWEDIKFGVDNQVDFYAVSFVKDAKVVHELKDYLKGCNADIHVIVKIESADSIPNLHSIISASDGAMVARGDLGAELPIEEVPLLQEDIIRRCRNMHKPVIVATNMLESMINHPTPTRAEVSDIAIAVREGADAIMLSGETAHGKYPIKAVKVMHTVALRTESSLLVSIMPPVRFNAYKSHMGEMFAFHSTTMANTLDTPIIVFTRTGSMAILLSHYRPSSSIFAFTNEERIKQRLALYQGVMPIYMQFSDDVEETFSRALKLLMDKNLVEEGEHVTLVQSGAQPIWRQESTHHIQVRKVLA